MAATLSAEPVLNLNTNKVSKELNNKLLEKPSCIDISEHYELQKCARWIEENGFLKVSLQFPDELLNHADIVSIKLQEWTKNVCIYILADNSYSSCCVDEVAAEHVSSDAIIHFGPACLTPCNRLPVLYIFGKGSINVTHMMQEFLKCVPDKAMDALLIYDVTFSHVSGEIYNSLKQCYPNLRPSELVIPSNNAPSDLTKSAFAEENTILISGRKLMLKEGLKIEDYVLFYIGQEGPTLNKLMMTLNRCRLYSYNPLLLQIREESVSINKSLRKRYYAVEMARDSRIVGILMGTLGVTGYLEVVQRLKEVAKRAGKKTYTIVVGKLNPNKLANFPEIDVFVLVACPDNSTMDFKDFYRPIVTPFEFELACVEDRQWTGEYVTDFRELMPGARHYVPLSDDAGSKEQIQTNVSLITGKLSTLSARTTCDDFNSADRTVATKDDVLTIAEIHSQSGGEFLINRSWQGLDSGASVTPVAVVRQGVSGIASSYSHENQLLNNK